MGCSSGPSRGGGLGQGLGFVCRAIELDWGFRNNLLGLGFRNWSRVYAIL